MRLRRWIGWLAVAAILLHTATVARHSIIMFNSATAEVTAAALEAGVICHFEADADSDGQGLPGKNQGSPSKPCPICLGMSSAFALHVCGAPSLSVPQITVTAAPAAFETVLASSPRRLLQLSRAPPSLV